MFSHIIHISITTPILLYRENDVIIRVGDRNVGSLSFEEFKEFFWQIRLDTDDTIKLVGVYRTSHCSLCTEGERGKRGATWDLKREKTGANEWIVSNLCFHLADNLS